MYIHCCKDMDFFLDEGKVGIGYSPEFRMYYIDLKRSKALQIIKYCPWCGAELPKNLDRMWFELLEEAGFDDPLSLLDNPLTENVIPQEFKTDEWWKKRCL